MRVLACFVGLSLAACGGSPPLANPPGPPAPPAPLVASSPYPPSILTGSIELQCVISDKLNGQQTLTLTGGTGLEFNATVSPIVDGTVTTKGPEQGGAYRFTSHLAGPATGKLTGVGDVTFDELETKVAVEMDHYKQPGGAGTLLTFTSNDISKRGVYVEFTGRVRAANGDHYAFRVNLGPATGGSGEVKPRDANASSPIVSKMVVIQAPVMTSLQSTTEIQKLPPP